ncbi:uncharacterized protein yc1106_09511 [Curvularia clavata]|uniref:Uncharacterized protein n=1 Tax=Curvularia clavata TaxID=95742 RepID=A0A9Q9DWU5_CURCL|nr:uncharacterized protein yc1106_09511 [Curvularia clavata]
MTYTNTSTAFEPSESTPHNYQMSTMPPSSTTKPYDDQMHDSSDEELTKSHHDHISESQGLHLVVDFAWSKFRNIINQKLPDGRLEPLYVQHFRPTKPQLRFGYADPTDPTKERKADIASGTINNVAIDGECMIHGRTIHIKPLKRWRTQYNYLSHAIPSVNSDPVPINWVAKCSLKYWNFVCINTQTQEPIAKFSVNFWAIKQVGNIYFEKPREMISQEVLDELVVTGMTIVYIMMTRTNNPFNIVGAVFAKTGKVEGSEA